MVCIGCIAIGVLGYFIIKNIIKFLYKKPKIPQLERKWWGPGQETKEDDTIQTFEINIKDEVLTDLKQRLENARPFIPPLEGIQHQYGINTKLLTEIVEYWKTKYDWREREKFLNQFPQYTIQVQGLRIHYIHVKPQNTEGLKVLPLLILHGWPGSVREFYELIPILTTPRSDRTFVFEVIAPSLPGYGFSDGAVRPGLGSAQLSVLFNDFMKKIGYEKYYIQGGDWGAFITQSMAALFPKNILGLHSNMCVVMSPLSMFKNFIGSICPSLIVSKEHQHKMYPYWEKMKKSLCETGYLHLQATKPDTIGVALNDSPVGLAAYILEKFISWTNPKYQEREDGGLLDKFTYDALLDNVMIYWVTNSITTSVRLYAEEFCVAQRELGITKIPITVPTSVARYEYELSYIPTSILKERFKNIVHEADLNGGHFPAFECPQLFANNLFEGFERILDAQNK